MAKYLLTTRLYKILTSRGYDLICKKCGFAILPKAYVDCLKCGQRYEVDEAKGAGFCQKCGEDLAGLEIHFSQYIESKPSRYVKFICLQCERTTKRKPQVLICDSCNGRIICSGRKFYHAECYEEYFIGEDNEGDDTEE